MRCLSPLAPATLRHMRHMSARGSSADLVTRPGKCSDKLGPGFCDLWMFPRNSVKWGVELTQPGAWAAKGAWWIWRELVPCSLLFSSPQLRTLPSVAVTASPVAPDQWGRKVRSSPPPPPGLGHTQSCLDHGPALHYPMSYHTHLSLGIRISPLITTIFPGQKD